MSTGDDMNNKKENRGSLDKIIRDLLAIDSSIRNGQFLYAHREANKLLSEINRNEYEIDPQNSDLLQLSIKRTILFLRPLVKIYSLNQTSLDIARKALKCSKMKN